MKKVLSVLLAGAMMFGMSVASFATTFGYGTATPVDIVDGNNLLDTGAMFVERDGAIVDMTGTSLADDFAVEAGDILYFELHDGTDFVKGGAPSNWKIKLSDATYVAGASFVEAKATNVMGKKYPAAVGNMFVKVELSDDFDHYTEDSVKFYFYIYDTKNKTASEKVKVTINFADYAADELSYDELDWVISVARPTTYKYVGTKSKVAVMDFGGYFAEFKMYNNEKYTVSATTKYNKELSKEYDTDVEEINFRLGNVENADLFFVSAKDNKQIVAVVDGELVPVESTYETAHKFNNGSTAKGYAVEDAEYTVYAMISADVEIAVEEEAPVETPVEADKANPETGAADFVGAAVAMAVVSVAAAGALALKK